MSSQFPEKYLLEPPALQAALAGEHAHAATAVAHAGIHLSKSYPTDIDEGDRLHYAAASTTMGMDRLRVLAEAAARDATSIIDYVCRATGHQYDPPGRKDYNRLAAALDQVPIDALAVQPEVKVFEADQHELAFEVLRDEIVLPRLSETEREAWVQEHVLALLALGAAHPDLLYQLSRLCPKAAEHAQASARRKLKKADAEEHKRFGRAASQPIPLVGVLLADAVELGRSEVQLRREAEAENLAAEVFSRTGTAAREGKAASDYIANHRDVLLAALEELREGDPHLSLDNTIPADVVLSQLPQPTEASRELVAVLYNAIASHGDTPAAVARALFDAIKSNLEQVRLDPVVAILQYLDQAGYDDTALIARATDELLAPALATHAEKAATVLAGDLPRPLSYIVHTSPFTLPFVATGLFEEELRVVDHALDDVVVILSLYPYRLRDLAFYRDARSLLDSTDANRFYTTPARKPQPAVSRTTFARNGQSPSTLVHDPEPVTPI